MQHRTVSDLGLGRERPTRRVLVVDDVPEICDLFRRIARRIRTHDVQLVTEVNSARAKALLQREPFDLVVSDFRMREVDGIEVLSTARQANPGGRRVLITGYNELPAPLAHIREAEVDAYLQKPLEDQDLVVLLGGLLAGDAALLEETRGHARALEKAAEDEERQVMPGG